MAELMAIAGIAVKTSLVVVAAGVLSLTMRRQSAASGHALWTMALALCVSMPPAVVLLPSHDVVVLPSAPTLPVPGALGSEWAEVVQLILALWLIGTSLVLRELLATIGLARWRQNASPLSSKRWTATLTAHGFDHHRPLTPELPELPKLPERPVQPVPPTLPAPPVPPVPVISP